MAPVGLAALARDLSERFGRPIPEHIAVSSALYPRVIDEHLAFTNRHEDVSVLDTPTYFHGLEPGQEINVNLEPGKRTARRTIAEVVPDLKSAVRPEHLLVVLG